MITFLNLIDVMGSMGFLGMFNRKPPEERAVDKLKSFFQQDIVEGLAELSDHKAAEPQEHIGQALILAKELSLNDSNYLRYVQLLNECIPDYTIHSYNRIRQTVSEIAHELERK
jgi:hypothetical protein